MLQIVGGIYPIFKPSVGVDSERRLSQVGKEETRMTKHREALGASSDGWRLPSTPSWVSVEWGERVEADEGEHV